MGVSIKPSAGSNAWRLLHPFVGSPPMHAPPTPCRPAGRPPVGTGTGIPWTSSSVGRVALGASAPPVRDAESGDRAGEGPQGFVEARRVVARHTRGGQRVTGHHGAGYGGD